MNVADLLQDSPSEERKRSNTSASTASSTSSSNNNGHSGVNPGQPPQQQQQPQHSQWASPSPSTTSSSQPWQPAAANPPSGSASFSRPTESGSWATRRAEEGAVSTREGGPTTSPSLAARGRSASSPMQPMQGHGGGGGNNNGNGIGGMPPPLEFSRSGRNTPSTTSRASPPYPSNRDQRSTRSPVHQFGPGGRFPASAPTHQRTLSQPNSHPTSPHTTASLPSSTSPLLARAAENIPTAPRGGVWGPAAVRPVSGGLVPDARGTLADRDSTRPVVDRDSTLPLSRHGRDAYRDMDRDRDKDQPRILNFMDVRGDRDRERLADRPRSGEAEAVIRERSGSTSNSRRNTMILGAPEDLTTLNTLPALKSHSQSPVTANSMPSTSRRSSGSVIALDEPGLESITAERERDLDYIRTVRRSGTTTESRPVSAPALDGGPKPPNARSGGEYPHIHQYQQTHFQPPTHFPPPSAHAPHPLNHSVPAPPPHGVPAPAPIPAPAPGTLALVPPQHQQSHQQHQLAQAQAQQQQMHVNAQGPVLQGPSTVGTMSTGPTIGVMEPRGGTIVNLSGPGPSTGAGGTSGGPPQKQFQNQFHTQFLPGFPSSSSGAPQGPGMREPRERDRDRDRDRERDRGHDRERELSAREREREWDERDREQREREREREMREREQDRDMYPHHHPIGYGHHPHSAHNSSRGSPLPMGMGMGVLVPDRERERERDMRERERDGIRERERERDRDSRQRHPALANAPPPSASRRHPPGGGIPPTHPNSAREKDIRDRDRERERERDMREREREFREREREQQRERDGYRVIGGMPPGPGSGPDPHHPHPRDLGPGPGPGLGPREMYAQRERERIDREREREREIQMYRERDREHERQRERERERMSMGMGIGMGERNRERERDPLLERERTRLQVIGDMSSAPQGPGNMHMMVDEPPMPMPSYVGDAYPGSRGERGVVRGGHGIGPGMEMGMQPGIGMGMGMMQEEVEEVPEREVKSRVRIDLGTYVWPRTPFPYFFGESKWEIPPRGARGSNKENEPGEGPKQQEDGADKMAVDGDENKDKKDSKDPVVINLDEHSSTPPTNAISTSSDENDPNDPELLDSETLVTVSIPSGFIPLEKPKPSSSKYKIWGGGVVSRSNHSDPMGLGMTREREFERELERPIKNKSPNKRSSNNATSSSSAPTSGSPNKKQRRRRIYTDDSDIFLCAVHSGWVTWSGARKARLEGKDLKVRLRVIRCLGVREDVAGVDVEGTRALSSQQTGNSLPGSAKKMPNGHATGSWSVNGKGTTNSKGAPNGVVSSVLSDVVDLDPLRSKRGKEEVVARFMGGMGEKYFGGDNQKAKNVKVEQAKTQKAEESEREAGELKEEGELDPDVPLEVPPSRVDADAEMDVEEEPDVGPEDDGRSLLSAGWGTGHDGSGIEVVDAEFVSRNESRRSGIRSRSQRLLEYAERRIKVFANDDVKRKGPFVTTSIIGRKRSRGAFETSYPVHTPRWGWTSTRQLNAVALGTILEEHEEPEEKRAFLGRTLLFGKDAEPWFKYDPDALRTALATPNDDDDLAQRPSKRPKTEVDEPMSGVEEKIDLLKASPPFLLKWDDSDRCCILKITGLEVTDRQYTLLIAQESRAKEYLDQHMLDSLPKLPSTSTTRNDQPRIIESVSPETIRELAAMHSESLSPSREFGDDDWISHTDCMHTKAEDMWIVRTETMQFAAGGMKLNGDRILPVKRWKFLSVL